MNGLDWWLGIVGNLPVELGPAVFGPYDDARWATNWNAQSFDVRAIPVDTCPDKGGANAPKLFGCNTTAAYQSFRNALPGETGDRAPFRLPGYVTLDLGLHKAFTMPWGERQKLEIRFEGFNVTNTQRMGAIDVSRTGYGITADPGGSPFGCSGAACVSTPATPPTNWSNFTGIQGSPRVLQVGLRYS